MNINIDSGELFITYAAKMNIVARLIVGDATEAEDVVGDVFADVASCKIRLPDDNAEAMLMTCLRNKCYNILRRKTIAQRVKQLARLDDTIDYQPPEDTDDKLEKISHFISSKLTPQTARIIRMHYQQKLKYREIATMLGISETAVYKHLAQGIRKLRMEFNNL